MASMYKFFENPGKSKENYSRGSLAGLVISGKLVSVIFSFLIVIILGGAVGCSRTPLKQIDSRILSEIKGGDPDKALGEFNGLSVNAENLSYLDFNNEVFDYKKLDQSGDEIRNEILKKQLLRRSIVMQAIRENAFQDEDAFRYIWPRLEKILEDYYFYRKFSYEEIYRKKMALYYGEKAADEFYKKNKSYFDKSRLGKEEVDNLLRRKVESLALAEWNQKKLEFIGNLLKEHEFKMHVK